MTSPKFFRYGKHLSIDKCAPKVYPLTKNLLYELQLIRDGIKLDDDDGFINMRHGDERRRFIVGIMASKSIIINRGLS